MKVYEVLLLLGALVVTVARVTSEDAAAECRGDPETDRWRKDCNWCSCRNGRQACTRRACPQGRQEEGPQCEGHPSWKEDCNDCVCVEGKVTCTSAYCGTLAGSQARTVTVERQLFVCEEGSRWRDGCNWCVCEEGKSSCTKSACTDWNESTALAEGVVQCHGTSRWKKDCNWCNCVNGRGVCTLLACIPPERDPFHNLPEGAMCVPGSRWKDECNWCSCGETGHGACTLMGCLPGFKDDGPTCEDGSVWKEDECNICRCINGASACSKRLCRREDPGSTSPQLPQEPQCQGDPETDRWRQNCNWCRCLNGVGACTKRLCGEGRREEGPQCEGSPTWKKDCNSCYCANGTAVCTFKFCGPLPPRPSPRRGGTEPQCQGDSETDRWRQDCNWCRCRNGVGTCTRRLCPEGTREEGPECEGNPSWKKGCNTCSCVNGNAICTTKFCGPLPARPAVHREALEPECQGDPETDRWNEDCNSCQCRNGVAACTKKLCRKDEENLPVCEGNPSWKKDCNRCHCNNGTALCTTMFCGGPLATPRTVSVQLIRVKNRKHVCEDGSRWRVKCNWCSCHEGRASCTRKDCLDQKAESDEPECEGDATYKKDCNWCTCGDGFALCTRMACPKPVEEPCTEGTSWREDCNLCRCSQGFVLCTKKACVKRDKELECQGDSCGPSQLPDLCHLPPVSGPLQCTAFLQKWSFFANDGQCKQIVYGGCGGTANLFNTKEECEAACPTSHAAAITPARQLPLAGQSVSAGGERCTLPQVVGPCFAALPRYAYNAKTGSCEPFIYGGCMGNANNFMTEEECITACQGNPACDKSECPWHLWGHYLAKECVPQYAGDACCPTSFSCPSASESGKDLTKCYYKGTTYNPRDEVPVEDPCSASCTCVEAREPNRQSTIQCANVECPDLFRPPPPGCRPLYRADRCCPYDRECTEPGTPPLESRSATCVWKNKTYHEGDKIYFDDAPCRFCICGPGFTDPYGPGCSKLDCGLDFRYTTEYSLGCTPIFFETNRCCPITWMCPDDSRIDHQQQQQKPGTVDELAVCHLGDKRLAVGEALALKACDLECRCVTPPELTCTKYRTCQLAEETAAQRACQPLECGPGCRPLVSGPKQCPTCSCSPDTFSCPTQTCPSTCHSELDLKTGCPSCKCKCPSEVPCPTGCPVHTVLDEATGCPYCECKSGSPQVRSSSVSCPVYPDGRVPCPQDCAIIKRVDENGCEVCECDPNDSETPFGPHHPPPPPSDPGVCRGEGEAPCPMDCGIIRRMDDNGCEVCECDPDDTSNPFGHPLPPNPPTPCRTLPDGRAPCPMDCAIIRYKDENGCEVCKCDPNKPGTPFGPYRRPVQHEV